MVVWDLAVTHELVCWRLKTRDTSLFNWIHTTCGMTLSVISKWPSSLSGRRRPTSTLGRTLIKWEVQVRILSWSPNTWGEFLAAIFIVIVKILLSQITGNDRHGRCQHARVVYVVKPKKLVQIQPRAYPFKLKSILTPYNFYSNVTYPRWRFFMQKKKVINWQENFLNTFIVAKPGRTREITFIKNTTAYVVIVVNLERKSITSSS